MNLYQMSEIASEVAEALAPHCERIEVAGSIRRRKANPKDVEIVFIPARVLRPMDLFSSAEVPATDEAIAELVRTGVLAYDTQVKRDGPKYKRFIHCASGVVVELFAAVPQNWGLILALRTGPGDFNHVLVSKPWAGGAMPLRMRMQGGYLWRNGQRCDTTADEEGFFATLGVPCWPPQQRTVERLRTFLKTRQAVRR